VTFYRSPTAGASASPADYRHSRGSFLDPYNQNYLKGDYPIIGQDKFLVVTATSDTLFEARKLPVPSGVSSLKPGSLAFFGVGDQFVIRAELHPHARTVPGRFGLPPARLGIPGHAGLPDQLRRPSTRCN